MDGTNGGSNRRVKGHVQVKRRVLLLRGRFYGLEEIVRVCGSLHLARNVGRQPATVYRDDITTTKVAVKIAG